MDIDHDPSYMEHAYLRIFSGRTRKKDFPQYFKPDVNGDTRLNTPVEKPLEVPKFQETEFRDSTTAARQPEIRNIAELSPGSKSQSNISNLYCDMIVDTENSNTIRPSSAPEVPVSTSSATILPLPRTVTRTLIKYDTNYVGETPHSLNRSVPMIQPKTIQCDYFGEIPHPWNLENSVQMIPNTKTIQSEPMNFAKFASKKSVAFKEKLVEYSSDPTLQCQWNYCSPTKSVLKKSSSNLLIEQTPEPDHSENSTMKVDQSVQTPTPTKRKIASRIPIPISRARGFTSINSVPSSKTQTTDVENTKNDKVRMRSTPNSKLRNGNMNKLSDIKSKNSEESLQETNSNQMSFIQNEINSQEDSYELCKTSGTADFTSRISSTTSIKGVSEESLPQLYDSDSSISSTRYQGKYEEEERKSQGESYTIIAFKDDNNQPISDQHNYNHENANESLTYESAGDTGQTTSQTNETTFEINSPLTKASDITLAEVPESESGDKLECKKVDLIPCRYSTAGCSEELPKGTLAEEEHYKQCRYRPIPCLFSRLCNEVVPYHNFILHHNKHFLHPNYTSTLTTSVFICARDFLAGETWIPKWLSTYDNHFFLMINHTRGYPVGTGTWVCWMWMLGSPDEAVDYAYEITMFKGLRKIQGTFTVQSIRTLVEEIEKTNSGLVFTDLVAKKLAGMSQTILGDFVLEVNIIRKPSYHREKPSYTGPYKDNKAVIVKPVQSTKII